MAGSSLTLEPCDHALTDSGTPEAIPAEAIEQAYQRIAPFVHQTPVLSSTQLNNMLGHTILFKVEGFQKTGAFKARGALNSLLKLKEQKQLPTHVVTFSSGNHAQAVAWAGSILGVKTTVFLPAFTSAIKQQATRAYGANVILTENRQEAEARTAEMQAQGAYFIHPFDHDDIIAGQGTSCYEAFKFQDVAPDAIFATCGGGGWLSGTYLATQCLGLKIPVFGAEPLQANDAATSYKTGKIHRFSDSPPTLADGARAMAVSARTFQYLQKLSGFYEVDESAMVFWTQWLSHLLKTTVEPTSATAMAGAHQWLDTQSSRKTVLILLSGGNIAPDSYQKIWETNHLQQLPE